jgi:glyoxylase-like metal-dependent hydrolase (beta-lactamase superfamily II)
METIKRYHVGDVVITRVTEQVLSAVPSHYLFPQWDDAFAREQASWLGETHMSADRENLALSVHTWLVQTGEHTILIDTASGNGKQRPLNPLFHDLNLPYLDNLMRMGVAPADIDFVLITHQHVDHVGWNTVKKDGRWVPTFPNAEYVFSRAEYDFYANPANVDTPSVGVFEDSVKPVVDAGLVRFIEDDDEGGKRILPGFTFHRTKGHSFDHRSISLRSKGQVALFTGDVVHHPIQIATPQWNSVFCEFPDEAVTSRRWALDFTAEHGALFCSSHFSGTSAGRVAKHAQAYSWTEE